MSNNTVHFVGAWDIRLRRALRLSWCTTPGGPVARAHSASIAACLLLLLSACRADVTSREFAAETTGGSAPALAAPPDKGEIQYSRFAPDPPSDEIVKGLLSQTVYDTARDERAMAAIARGPAPGPRYRIEVRTLLVGPGRRTESATLPGAAIFEVRSGAGTFAIGEKTQEITTGSTFAVSDGESFTFASGADTELTLRVYIIRLQ